MPLYRVVIDAEFVTKAPTRDNVAHRVRNMLRQAGFALKDYECSISYITPKEAEALEAALALKEEPTP